MNILRRFFWFEGISIEIPVVIIQQDSFSLDWIDISRKRIINSDPCIPLSKSVLSGKFLLKSKKRFGLTTTSSVACCKVCVEKIVGFIEPAQSSSIHENVSLSENESIPLVLIILSFLITPFPSGLPLHFLPFWVSNNETSPLSLTLINSHENPANPPQKNHCLHETECESDLEGEQEVAA